MSEEEGGVNMPAPKVTDKAIQRAISATQEAGIPIGAIIVNNSDGTIRIEAQQPAHLDDTKPTGQAGPKKWA